MATEKSTSKSESTIQSEFVMIETPRTRGEIRFISGPTQSGKTGSLLEEIKSDEANLKRAGIVPHTFLKIMNFQESLRDTIVEEYGKRDFIGTEGASADEIRFCNEKPSLDGICLNSRYIYKIEDSHLIAKGEMQRFIKNYLETNSRINVTFAGLSHKFDGTPYGSSLLLLQQSEVTKQILKSKCCACDHNAHCSHPEKWPQSRIFRTSEIRRHRLSQPISFRNLGENCLKQMPVLEVIESQELVDENFTEGIHDYLDIEDESTKIGNNRIKQGKMKLSKRASQSRAHERVWKDPNGLTILSNLVEEKETIPGPPPLPGGARSTPTREVNEDTSSSSFDDRNLTESRA